MKYYFIILTILTILTSCRNEMNVVEEKPNIVFILADDLGYGDLSCYGQQKFSTPNIDQLAKEGLLFRQFYAGATVCAPSRSALLTGLHTGHTPIRGNKEVQPEGQYPLADSVLTLAEVMKKNGYSTGVFGKWGLGFPGSEGVPGNQGFDEFYGYNCQRLAHHYYPRYLWKNQTIDSLRSNFGLNKGVYAPELIQKEALSFIERNQSQPFFLFYAAVAPHAELVAPVSYMKKFQGQFSPEKTYTGLDGGPDYRKGSYESQLESHAAFAAMISHLDDRVGELMAKLADLGIADNTLVIFTSDNGPHKEGGADPDFFNSNGPFKGYKRDLYEGGIRVPMIAKWPGTIKPGTESNHVAAFWDVMPTINEIIGAESAANIDGISFAPTLSGQAEQIKHDYLYWEFHELGGRRALRKDNWKLVEYEIENSPVLNLFDLESDLSESNDLSEKYPMIFEELKEIMSEARTSSPVFQFADEKYDAQ